MPDDFALISEGGAVVADMADAILFADDTDEEYCGQMVSAYPESILSIKVVFSGCAEYSQSAVLRYQSAFLNIVYSHSPKVIALNTTWFEIQ